MSEFGPAPQISGEDAEARAPIYRTSPNRNLSVMPPGIPYIIGNEAAERFSFYGMRSILTVFMTTYLMSAGGRLAVRTTTWATRVVSGFVFRSPPNSGTIISDDSS
jgi:POT family proton-dependent oligopeptide transporter